MTPKKPQYPKAGLVKAPLPNFTFELTLPEKVEVVANCDHLGLGRFPQDFAFRLTQDEWTAVAPQVANPGTVSILRSQNATSRLHGGRRYLPVAFTEHGALMAANILNSPRAVAMSVYVIRAFVKMREDLVANAAVLKRLAEIDKTLLIHDSALRDIFQKLRPLMEPPPTPTKPEIGFHVKEGAVPYRIRTKRSPQTEVE